jgi:hypothetical protein
MSRPFFVELRVPMSDTLHTGRVELRLFFFACGSARQAFAGPAVYAVKERGQPTLMIVAFLILTSFPA